MSFQNVGTYNAGVFTPKAAGPAPVGGVPVMDADGIASGGAFLVSELEKRDPLIRKPLTSFTYPRDIVIQTGGGWVDYVSAMSVAYGITGGAVNSPVTAGGANGIPVVQASVDKGVYKAHVFAAALRVMNEKIKLRQIDKRYRCLVHGTPKPAEGRIELFMRKRSDENRIEVFHHPVPDGRTMITEYKVLDSNGRYSLLEVHLITGRTHQIRATMAEIGHPLVGEGKYSSMKNDLGFRFQALCAWSLTFRFEGDSAPLDYLNGRTFTVGVDPFARYLRDRK